MASFGDENRQMTEAMAQLSQMFEILIEGIQGVQTKCYEAGLSKDVVNQVSAGCADMLFNILNKNIK